MTDDQLIDHVEGRIEHCVEEMIEFGESESDQRMMMLYAAAAFVNRACEELCDRDRADVIDDIMDVAKAMENEAR